MRLNNLLLSALSATVGTMALLATPVSAQPLCRYDSCVPHRSADYVAGDDGEIGIGRTAFPIKGAVPKNTPYNPYHFPFSYDWPYGYGLTGN